MKKINVLMIAMAILVLSACNALEDAATVKVDVPDFTIEIPTNVTLPTNASGITRADSEQIQFSGSYTLSITESQFNDLRKYKNLITDIKIEDVTITIQQDGLSGTAQNIMLKATNVVPDFNIPTYTFGQTYRNNPALPNFIKSTIFELKNDSVTITFSGKTSVDFDAIGDVAPVITIEVKGIQVWAKTIEF
jgi:hypothetical protein